jgi:sodium/potassium/calcium exchanger 6
METLHVLFPTLHEFHSKSLLGKIAAVFATPAVFMLTVTLPVVVRPYDSQGYPEKTPSTNHTLSIIDEDGNEPTLVAEEEQMREFQFNKWLMAIQCVFGPVFCTAVLFSTLVYLGSFSHVKISDISYRGYCT